MTIPHVSPRVALEQLIRGMEITQALAVIARLGIADLLQDGPKSSEELALATGSHAPSLYRVLRLLGAVAVLSEAEDHHFSLTPLGAYLQTNIAGSLHYQAINFGASPFWDVWGALQFSVATGDPAYQHVFGMTNWDYRSKHPEANTLFNQFMSESSATLTPAIASNPIFARFGTLVDVGGNQGKMLSIILAANPGLTGVLFDLPHVLAGAPAVLEAAGVTGRTTVIGGDVFREVPAGYDAYLLSRVLHDWNDEQSIAILTSCRQAMPTGSTLLVLERVIDPGQETTVLTLESDLHMLVGAGGKERTADEYASLFSATGLHLEQLHPVDPSYQLLEATGR